MFNWNLHTNSYLLELNNVLAIDICMISCFMISINSEKCLADGEEIWELLKELSWGRAEVSQRKVLGIERKTYWLNSEGRNLMLIIFNCPELKHGDNINLIPIFTDILLHDFSTILK